MKLYKDSSGELIKYAWPGGYPVIYLAQDGEVFCPDCANGKNDSDAYVEGTRPEEDRDEQWEICGGDIYYEGDPIPCVHCNGEIESAYGPLEDDE